MSDQTQRIDPTSLLAEKRLIHIWIAFNTVKPSKFNWFTAIAVGFAVLGGVQPITSVQAITSQVRSISDIGLNVSVSILGFLIAGYTILASTSNILMLQRMAERQDTESGLSVLKRNYFALVVVFVEFLALAVVCAVIRFFCYQDGPASVTLNFFEIGSDIRLRISKVAMGFICGFIIFDLMQLKSFIFNVHHFVMTSVAWSLTERYTEEDRKSLEIQSSDQDRKSP
ncbi:MAG: hypothetical protein FD138_2085 [Planctomycetota bacterium]|nr:MAG: hypothetical protein FD138_2085 [Planctomycetota bacterium]